MNKILMSILVSLALVFSACGDKETVLIDEGPSEIEAFLNAFVVEAYNSETPETQAEICLAVTAAPELMTTMLSDEIANDPEVPSSIDPTELSAEIVDMLSGLCG